MKTLAVIAVTAMTLGACGQNDVTTPTQPAPATTDAAPPDTTEPDDDGATFAVFFVRSTPTRFYVEPEFKPGSDVDAENPLAAATEALNLLFAASEPTDPSAPTDPELFTSIPEGVTLNSITLDGNTAVVDVSGLLGTSGASAQETTLLLQITHTATYATGATGIQLLFDGNVEDELYGHVDVSQVIEVSDFDLTPVTIVSPAYGATAPVGDVTFSGEALVFEANVVITLVNQDTGATLYAGSTMATAGGPDRGDWEWTYTFTDPGTYTLTAAESDPSDGEGRPPYGALRTIVIG